MSLHAIREHIVKHGGKYVVLSHDRSKRLGTYKTRAEAEKRLRQVEYFKHREAVDASGHEHGKDGRFVASGKARKASKAAHEVSQNLAQWAKLSRTQGHESSEYTHPAGTAVKHSAASVRAARVGAHALASEHHRSAAMEHEDAAAGHRGYSGNDVRHEEAAKYHLKAAKAHRKAAGAHSGGH